MANKHTLCSYVYLLTAGSEAPLEETLCALDSRVTEQEDILS